MDEEASVRKRRGRRLRHDRSERRVGHRKRKGEKNREMRYFRANHEIVSIGVVFVWFAPLNVLVSKTGFWAVLERSKITF